MTDQPHPAARDPRVVVVPLPSTGEEEAASDRPDEAGSADDEDVRGMVAQPAKVMRIGTMVKQLLDEVRSAPLDDAARARLAEVHERSLHELEEGLSPELFHDPYGEEPLSTSKAEFEKLLAEYSGDFGAFREGEIVEATVLRVTDAAVILEFGFKSEGAVALDEFKEVPEVGSAVEDFDVAIIGGGINGCGTFRDLCAQGVRCLLIERDDFCAGASSASSRLMHGGLKYLETGEFRLVRESATERNMLLSTAPHVVSALPCIVPVRSWSGGILGSIARFFRMDAKLKDRGFLITALGLGVGVRLTADEGVGDGQGAGIGSVLEEAFLAIEPADVEGEPGGRHDHDHRHREQDQDLTGLPPRARETQPVWLQLPARHQFCTIVTSDVSPSRPFMSLGRNCGMSGTTRSWW